jgi:pyruvate formate lyase activating enzyme
MTTGRIFEIKRFAVHDGPGIRTTFFFKGCPLSCVWCHNPEGIQNAPEIALIERLCIGCGECVSVCPKKLHQLTDQQTSESLSVDDTQQSVNAGPKKLDQLTDQQPSESLSVNDTRQSVNDDPKGLHQQTDHQTSVSLSVNDTQQILPSLNVNSIDGCSHRFKREGCDLCLRCVNACMPQALKLYGSEYTAGELYKIAAGDVDFYKTSGGGITCSGGEPLMQADFASEFLKLCKDGGLHTAVDTSGYAPWQAFEKVIPYTDIFLYDIKHMNAAAHKRLTGKDNAIILENLEKLSSLGTPVEVRLPIIPGLNDGDENITQVADYLKSIHSLTQVSVLPYHAYSDAKYASIGRENNMPRATGGETDAANKVKNYLRNEGFI